jgi:hypothetical protein
VSPVRKTVYWLALGILAAGCHLDKLLSGGSGGGAPPRVATGALRAAALTSGSNLPTAYTVTVDRSRSTSIGVNDSVTTTGIAAGSHTAALGSVPTNCSVSGANPRTVTVPPNDTARTIFSVACVAPPPPATHLAFVTWPRQPVVIPNQFQVQVAALDDSGHVVTTFTGDLTVALAHDGSLTLNAKLSGTKQVSAVNGIATFNDLSIDQPGTGYTLKTSAANLPDATSNPFNVL